MDHYYQQLAALKPHPDLSPIQVVQIQLEALQNNDLTRDNEGIRICFRFASPENRETTGPIGHFIALLNNPLYRPMIGFERAEFTQFMLGGNTARQTVRLIRTRKENVVYTFILSYQTEEPYPGCWMTDAVLRIG
jgi:Domain of unknown function (DUF4864)